MAEYIETNPITDTVCPKGCGRMLRLRGKIPYCFTCDEEFPALSSTVQQAVQKAIAP